jgi:hypothetical protein
MSKLDVKRDRGEKNPDRIEMLQMQEKWMRGGELWLLLGSVKTRSVCEGFCFGCSLGA